MNVIELRTTERCVLPGDLITCSWSFLSKNYTEKAWFVLNVMRETNEIAFVAPGSLKLMIKHLHADKYLTVQRCVID
jgi:hypothetical protein